MNKINVNNIFSGRLSGTVYFLFLVLLQNKVVVTRSDVKDDSVRVDPPVSPSLSTGFVLPRSGILTLAEVLAGMERIRVKLLSFSSQ